MEDNALRYCNIIFVVDASESMKGAKIGTVNSVFEGIKGYFRVKW